MKVTYIANSSIPSTSANSVHVMKICEAFKKQNIDIKLVVPDKGEKELLNGMDVYEFYGIKEKFPIKTYKILKKMRGINLYLFYLNIVLKEKADVIYTREIMVSFFCILLKRPHILELHGKIKYVSNILNNLFNKFNLFNSKYMLKLVVISKALKKIYIDEYKINENKISVLHDGVTIDNFKNLQPKELLKDKIEIGYIGSLYQGRGIDIILEIAKVYKDLNFNIYGGEENQIKEWQNYCIDKNINNVKFYGHIPNKDVPNTLVKQDILLMPYQKKLQTRGVQNTASWMSPMKMFEYMASGRIIISSDLPVLREVLNENNSFLVSPDNIEEWIKTIEFILNNKKIAIKKANQAKKDVLKYTWDSRVKKILEIIKENK